jgi:hypothetical protein
MMTGTGVRLRSRKSVRPTLSVEEEDVTAAAPSQRRSPDATLRLHSVGPGTRPTAIRHE